MSPITIAARITGTPAVVHRLGTTIPIDARARLRATLSSLGFRLQRLVQEEKLSGQVLKVQSGRLRRSINMRLTETPTSVTASVGTAVVYGRFWELGFHGTEQVRSYVRHVSGRDVRRLMLGTTASGHARITAGGSLSTRRTVAQGVGYVRAHSRVVNQAPRSFLKSALTELSTDIRATLAEAMRGL